MVFTALRVGAKKALTLSPVRITIVQNATLTGRGSRGGPLKLRDGFYEWEKKKISRIRAIFDITKYHVTEENARLIAVEGPIAAGKSALAKALAEEFDMRHFPEVTMDEYWINPYGFDYRTLDNQLPDSLRSYDEKSFCMDPFNLRKSFYFQYFMLQLRFYQQCDALAHILNTGQGVVLERNYFSDRVFAHAMRDEGYISKEARKFYDELVFNTHWTIFRPHVVIYLDVPVPIVQERIKARNLSWEVKGKALTTSYLENLEKRYKEYLKEISVYSDLLVYDWSEGGEVEAVVEDLEALPMKELEMSGEKKYWDWKISKRELYQKRLDFTNYTIDYNDGLNMNFNVPPYDVEEMWLEPDEFHLIQKVKKSIKGGFYTPGYNPDVGDNVWFKSKGFNHRRPQWHVVGEDILNPTR